MITADNARDLMPNSIVNVEKEIEEKIIEAAKIGNSYINYTIVETLEYVFHIVKDLEAAGFSVNTKHEDYFDFDDVKLCNLTIKW